MADQDWKKIAESTLKRIDYYSKDSEGWKVSKKQDEVVVWEKPSPDWDGMLYRLEGYLDYPPATVFSCIEPTPTSPRANWDRAVRELQMLEVIEENIYVIRTITHNAFGGLISSRDFIDLVINVENDQYISTNAQSIIHPGCPVSQDFVRGVNYPCSIACHRVESDPNKTKIVSYVQSDLKGMLPRTLVDSAMPSNQIDFFHSLKNNLQEQQHRLMQKHDD